MNQLRDRLAAANPVPDLRRYTREQVTATVSMIQSNTAPAVEAVTKHNTDGIPAARRRKIFLAAAAVAATVLLTLTPGALSSPAYAVEQGSNGDVTVRIDRLEDAQQLQRALRGFGVTADVRYLGDGMQCTPNRFQPAASAPRSRTQFSVGSNGISVVLDRRDVSQGQTVVISASHVGNGVHGEVGITAGPLAPCLPVPVPSP